MNSENSCISVSLADILSEENIFEDEQYGEDVHDEVDILTFTAGEVDDDIRDDAERDALGDAIEQRHCDNAEVSRYSRGVIFLGEFYFSDSTEHEEAYDNEGRGSCECRDSGKNRCEEH